MGSVRSRIAAAALLAAPLALAAPAGAQGYPSRPVRVIVPQSAGGSTDFVARVIAERLDDAFRQPVIVDNRPGAGSINGTEIVAKAAPDGHTLLVVAASFTITPNIRKSLPYDALRDFTPVAQLVSLPHILVVHPSLPVKTVKELVALAKAKPGSLNYGTSGIATSTHMAGELFMYLTGTKMVNIPYKGGAPGMVALLGGQVQLYFATISTAMPHVKAGKLRALGVTTPKRSVAYPEFPTIAEEGVPGYAHTSWVGMLAPAKTPAAVVARLNAETAKVLQVQETRALLLRDGLEAVGSSSKEFAELIRNELEKWARVVKAAGIQAE
ncbi:MAG TPA: tripartite tricarboxylate transporter substrate binding protein [Burkholderiales bacterium]|nr:tripartite tricarboxylate transporter substrate binding protein [Burkholderiales bacterium]